DLWLLVNAAIDNCIKAIAGSDWRDSTAIAIAKHLLDGEFYVLTQFRPEFCQPDLARGRQDGEPIALLVPDHDPLHQAVTRDVDLWLLVNAAIDNCIKAIAGSDWRDSTAIAIAKHLLDGEFYVLTQFRPEFCQPDLARGRQDGEPIALLVPDHDPLHQAVTRD